MSESKPTKFVWHHKWKSHYDELCEWKSHDYNFLDRKFQRQPPVPPLAILGNCVASSSVAPLGAPSSAAVTSNALPYRSTTPTVMQTLSPSYLGVNLASQAAVPTMTHSMGDISITSSRSQPNQQENHILCPMQLTLATWQPSHTCNASTH